MVTVPPGQPALPLPVALLRRRRRLELPAAAVRVRQFVLDGGDPGWYGRVLPYESR